MISAQTFFHSFGNLLNLSPNNHSQGYELEPIKEYKLNKSDVEEIANDVKQIGNDIKISMKHFDITLKKL